MRMRARAVLVFVCFWCGLKCPPFHSPPLLSFYGHTWQGCGSPDVDQPTVYPKWHADLFDADYGVPLGPCAETAPGSAVFTRAWSRATVALNCSDTEHGFSPNITML